MFGPDVSSKQPVVVRTEGQGVCETGERLTKEIILHPEQIDALNCGARLVHITGPPGTGKTVVLMLKVLMLKVLTGASARACVLYYTIIHACTFPSVVLMFR